jgi:hypothetical protein
VRKGKAAAEPLEAPSALVSIALSPKRNFLAGYRRRARAIRGPGAAVRPWAPALRASGPGLDPSFAAHADPHATPLISEAIRQTMRRRRVRGPRAMRGYRRWGNRSPTSEAPRRTNVYGVERPSRTLLDGPEPPGLGDAWG